MKRFLRELFKKMGQDVADFYHGYGRAILYWVMAVVVGYLIMHGYIALCIAFGSSTKGWVAMQIIGGVVLLFAEIMTSIWFWKAGTEVRLQIEKENQNIMGALRGTPQDRANRYRV